MGDCGGGHRDVHAVAAPAQAAPEPVGQITGEPSAALVVDEAAGTVRAAVRARMRPRDAPPVDQRTAVTGPTLRVPIRGFPDGFVPRQGDLVTNDR